MANRHMMITCEVCFVQYGGDGNYENWPKDPLKKPQFSLVRHFGGDWKVWTECRDCFTRNLEEWLEYHNRCVLMGERFPSEKFTIHYSY